MSMQRHSDGANSARPEHGALARHEYGLLALEGLEGNPATAGLQGSGDNPEDTAGIGDTDGVEKRTGERKKRRAPPLHAAI